MTADRTEYGSTETTTNNTNPSPSAARQWLTDRFDQVGVPPRRFIDVPDGEKGTRTVGHQKAINWLTVDDNGLNGNYGVHPGYGLIVFDVDDYDDEHDTDALDALPETFTVESPHTADDSPGHRYYAVEDDAVREVLQDIAGSLNPEPSWGEVKYQGKYVVGPGSQLDGCSKEWCDECDDPDGGYYRIAEDRPIATLSAEDIAEVLRADPEFADDQPTATEVFDLPTEETKEKKRDSDEWVTEEIAEEALDEISADVDYREWAAIGFALSNHFGEGPGGRLFREWSRSGTKWDADADDLAARIISDAGRYPHGISVLVRRAKEHGWDAKAAARKARATASDDGAPSSNSNFQGSNPETGEDEGEWGRIRTLMRSGVKGTTGEAEQGAAFALLDEFDLVTVEETRTIWRYDPEMGTFSDDAETRLRKRLADGLGWTYSESRVRGILHRIQSETFISTDDLGADDPHLLCLKNGVLDLRELREMVEEEGIKPIEAARNLTLHSHSPEYRFISRLNVAYDPGAYGDGHPGWERWTRYIGERVQARDITNTQEYAGYCLHGDYPFKKAFLALGPHNSGKTTFLAAIHRLFPDNSVATEPVQDLTNNRFSAVNLHGARVNIAGDLGTRELQDLERFKTVTGAEERMRGEIKGEQAFSFKPTAKFLWAANNVPEVDDPDDKAFINRWVFAEFPNEIEKPDDRVKQRLLRDETLQAVLLWALGGYATLFGWDGSNRGLSQERSIEAKRAMWNKHGDTIDQFIVQCLDLTGDTDDKVAVTDVYKAYQEFCHHREKPAETKDSFSKSVLAQALITDGQCRVDSPFSGTDRPRCYIGARYSDLGEQFWAVAAGKISRDALDEEIDPDEWVDDRDDRDEHDEQGTDNEQGDDSTADIDDDEAASNGDETADSDAGDGGPRGREDQLIEVMQSLGGDTDPVAKGVIFGRASTSMDIKQAEYAFNDLRDRGAIYAPPDTDGDAWMLSR